MIKPSSTNLRVPLLIQPSSTLAKKEVDFGLTFVAFSRVRTLEGLLLRGCYGKDRIMKLNLHVKHQLREEAEEWLNTLPQNI